MTDKELYLAIGIPGALFALNFLGVLAAAFWQSRRFDDLAARLDARIGALEKTVDVRFEALEKLMDARFAAQTEMLLRVEGVLDARLKHLEDREK